MFKLIFILVLLAACGPPKPEFYINGKPCYARSRCVREESTYEYGYGCGLTFEGEYKCGLGYHWVNRCIEYKTDTIEIK